MLTLQRGATALLLLAVSCGGPPPVFAQQPEPLTQIAKIALPGINGDFDHFAYDLKRNRLISAAEENHTLELFDLKTGAHLKTIAGFKAPHSIAYIPETDEIFVTDGDDASCIVLSAKDLHRVDRIALRPGADSALYDPAAKLYYIANGGREENKKTSVVTVLSVLDHKKVAEIPVQGDNVEAMAMDHAHHRLFINIRDQKRIGVVDLATDKVVSTWIAPGMNRNTPMKFDAPTQRLFVAGRTPGRLYIFNTGTGRIVRELDSVDSADDLTWDPATSRIYVTGSQGISIFRQNSPDDYSTVMTMKTIGGKTSLYVPELKQFYVAHPKGDTPSAALLIYRVNP
ncbi:MAG TPA: hypothetical protein VG714_11010 [Acidobacteriaceae bacterium]|nr:hypothetical protein [Acidobacteriaceae bacterium]